MLDFLLILLLFIPGYVLLNLLTLRSGLKLSKLDVIVLGNAAWTYLLVGFGYTVGILSSLMREFLITFTVVGVGLLIYYCYRLARARWVKRNSPRFNFAFFNRFLLFVSLVIPISVLTILHSLFQEFDSIFFYLPYAKSIVLTGSLRFDYFSQSGITTTISPGMPIIFAWFKLFQSSNFEFDLLSRAIPLGYVLLTTAVVYLVSREIFSNTDVAYISSICFLSMPIVSALSSNYSLYLDLPFTYFSLLGIYIISRIYNKPHTFWWLMLGIDMSLMLLMKDISYLLFPTALVLVGFCFSPRCGNRRRISIILLSVAFAGALNFLFVWDVVHFSIEMLWGFIARQTPIFILTAVFMLLLLRRRDLTQRFAFRLRHLLAFSVPLFPAVLYVLRNFIVFGFVSYSWIFSNKEVSAAIALMDEAAGITKSLPINISDVLRWDLLFRCTNLGAMLLLPAITGVLVMFFYSLRKLQDEYFVTLAFFLALIGLWSWVFNCSYLSSESRRLFYFAPLVAIFAAKGIEEVADFTSSKKNMTLRFTIFVSLSLLYLWLFIFKSDSYSIPKLSESLITLGLADAGTLAAFALLFVISFAPYVKIRKKVSAHSKVVTKRLKAIPHGIRLVVLAFPLVFLAFGPGYMVMSGLSNIQSNLYYVPPSWENNQYEVISYINQEIADNATMITCYALPISYFTDHPVIDVNVYEGVTRLLQIQGGSAEELRDRLISQDIRYLLFPKLGHSLYYYFLNLSQTIPVLGNEFTSSNYVLLLKNFTYFRLFKVI